MKKEFISYENALALKELGFDEPCFCIYNREKQLRFNNLHNPNDRNKSIKLTNNNGRYSAPTFSQAFRFFREKYSLYSHVRESYAFDNTLQFVTQINGSYVYHGIQDKPFNRFETYEEAELACLIKLIEVVKNK